MSETDPKYFSDDVPAEELADPKGLRAELAKAAAEKADLANQLAQNQRETALSKAGLELSDVQLTALAAVHKGEWNADSVKETASALGFVTEPKEESVVPEAEAESLAKVQALGAGAGAPNANQEVEQRMDSWAELGRSPISDTQFYNEVKSTLGEEFFEAHQRRLQT